MIIVIDVIHLEYLNLKEGHGPCNLCSGPQNYIQQGIVEGFAYKPALVQDTNYMVEKTYHIAPY